MKTTIEYNEKIRNYQGNNSFVIKMKEVIRKYGHLTEKQAAVVAKTLVVQTTINKDELPESIKNIVNYDGDNTFVMDIKAKFEKYASLTNNQIEAANKAIQKEKDSKNYTRFELNLDVVGETIVVTRRIGESLKKQKGLKFNPMLLDITEVVTLTSKAVKFKGKLTKKMGGVCKCCARTLTDDFSKLTGYGKICANYMGVEYIKDKSEVARFNEEMEKKIEEIGVFEFWVPRTKIKVWNGLTSMILKF